MQSAPRRKRSLVRRMPAKPKLTIAAHAAAVTIAVIVAAVTIAAAAAAAAAAASAAGALRVIGDTPVRDAGTTHQLRQELRLRPRLEDHRPRGGALSAHEQRRNDGLHMHMHMHVHVHVQRMCMCSACACTAHVRTSSSMGLRLHVEYAINPPTRSSSSPRLCACVPVCLCLCACEPVCMCM
jgi:hypothetical protein